MGTSSTDTRRRGARAATGARMLALVALSGAAALLAACAAPAADPSTAPPEPTASSAVGAAPVQIAEERLQAADLVDEVTAEGSAVRWARPGGPLAIVIGGSGGGGACIPQPSAAELGDAAGTVVVRFEPPDPAVMCTADFRLHGWELDLPAGIFAEEVTTVQLVDLQGVDETTEVEIGTDDLLDSGPTADPQPSLIPGSPPEGAGEPTRIPADRLPSPEEDLGATGAGPLGSPTIAARWIEPGRTLAILLGGSGAEPCVPTPVAAWTSGIGAIEAAFEPPSGDLHCSADFRLYGWSFPLAEPVSATLPVEVSVTGLGPDGASVVLTLQPDQLLEAP